MRRRHSDATRLRAIAIGREHGAAEAERQTGVRASTIRSWLARSDDDAPEVAAAEVAAGDALADAAGGVEALGASLTKAQAALDGALDRGDGLQAQRIAIAVGILSDKLAAARTAAPVPDALGAADALADNLEAFLRRQAASEVTRWASANVAELRAEVRRVHREIVRLGAQRRELTAEIGRRRRGDRSAFLLATEDSETWPEAWRPVAPEPEPVYEPPARSRYTRVLPRDAERTEVAEPVEHDADEWEAEPAPAEDSDPAPLAKVVRLERPRRYASVQQRILSEQGVDPSAFRPPR